MSAAAIIYFDNLHLSYSQTKKIALRTVRKWTSRACFAENTEACKHAVRIP